MQEGTLVIPSVIPMIHTIVVIPGSLVLLNLALIIDTHIKVSDIQVIHTHWTKVGPIATSEVEETKDEDFSIKSPSIFFNFKCIAITYRYHLVESVVDSIEPLGDSLLVNDKLLGNFNNI
jgi:hypothetical protein